MLALCQKNCTLEYMTDKIFPLTRSFGHPWSPLPP